MSDSPPDYRTQNLAIVSPALDNAIVMAREVIGVEITPPALAPDYPQWKGHIGASRMSYRSKLDAFQERDIIFYNAEEPIAPLLAEGCTYHETGHAATYQLNPDYIKMEERNPRLALELGEGIGEHFEIDLLRERTRRTGDAAYARYAWRICAAKAIKRRLPFRNAYTKGYYLVRGLRENHSLKEIVENASAIVRNLGKL
ncbi:TPA: hypothetical protein HA251_05510 [Candidatus Woesearchaeota archaeon]|nr:hypothetical protein [Candidatus Woesearchaeota archaeon]